MSRNIAIIGGGRWARVIVQVLANLTPPPTGISIHSPRNADAMNAWAIKRGLAGIVSATASWPDFCSRKIDAVIVANAARDHERAVRAALLKGVPVLVEKPFAISAEGAQSLIDLGENRETPLATAHVFLFARYIERFGKLVSGNGPLNSLEFIWSDPGTEHRYGEQKSYDPGLPIVADLLPHVVSILSAVAPGARVDFKRITLSRGGSRSVLELNVGTAPCRLELVRDGAARVRSVSAITGEKRFNLDFSTEPGVITTADATICGDPEWQTGKRPMALLLSAFLQIAAGGPGDERLDASLGLQVCQLTDRAMRHYRANQAAWLFEKAVADQHQPDRDLRYALRELLHASGDTSAFESDEELDALWSELTGTNGLKRLERLVNPRASTPDLP